MHREAVQENLVEEVTRLLGRPLSIVREAMSRMMTVLVDEFDSETARPFSTFPLTAWHAIAPEHDETRLVWSAMLSVGMTTEEVFTALAVVDDYVRRRYGDAAWLSVLEWGPRLARQYEMEIPRRGAGALEPQELCAGAGA